MLKNLRTFLWIAFVWVGLALVPLLAGCEAQIDGDEQVETPQILADAADDLAEGDAPILQVGEEIISASDLEERIQIGERGLAEMRDQIAAADAEDPFLSSFVALIEETGVEVVALASLIHESTLYQRALAEGYDVSGEELQANIVEAREAVADNIEGAAPVRATIEAIGAESYWSEVYSESARRDMILKKFWIAEAVPAPAPNHWEAIEDEMIRTVNIEILDKSVLDEATLDQALAYLPRFRELSQRYAINTD